MDQSESFGSGALRGHALRSPDQKRDSEQKKAQENKKQYIHAYIKKTRDDIKKGE